MRDEWQPLYVLGTRTVPQIDLLVGSWYVSTHPSSMFVTGLMVALTTADARPDSTGRRRWSALPSAR
ncbi:hypothetical protein MAHJHV35_48110 [Mycobacterium avium subsp. hominissuis]